ncbi:MAG: DegV family protein [Candidatus Metalachnospira sp.]|nr:DegV family protein [Candidatus Metalachnospira sp.]
MCTYKIVTDTASDIFSSVIDNTVMPRVPFYVTFDKENYYKEIVEMSIDDFYDKIHSDKSYPNTSQPVIADYISIFEPILQEGIDILCFSISSLFSGSYQSAVNAASLMKEKYPERKIITIDSLQATGGMGLIVYQAQLMLEAGYAIEENASIVEKIKHETVINWTVGSLDFLQHGGRIGKSAALAGTIFNVKPIICMKEGELFPVENVRGTKKAIKAIIDKTDREIKDHESDYYMTMFYADAYNPIMDTIAEHYSESKYSFIKSMSRIGVTIGSHTGPHLIALAYSKKYTCYDR